MKRTSLLCLLLCAVLLMAPLSVGVHADSTTPGTTESNPIVITAMPFEATVEVVADDKGVCPSVFYQYTATRACQLITEVQGDAVAVIHRNSEQIIGTVDMAEGDVISIELLPMLEGSVVLKLSERDFPLGSRYNPISLEFSKLEAGFTFDLTQQPSLWYKVTAPETGVLNFVSTDMPWGYRLGFNGNTTTDEATVIHHYAQNATRPITAGETFLLCAEYGAAEPGKFSVKISYVPPFTIDSAAQQVMFNSMYDVKDSGGNRIFGVEFNYASKTVAVMSFKDNEFLGSYNFNYNLKNGALELTNKRGEKAPFEITVVEDASKTYGAYLKLTYKGNYDLKALTVEEINNLKPDAAALDLLNGKYEDLFMGEVFETFEFFYELDQVDNNGEVIKVGERYVIVAPDWQSEGVVYYITSYSVFTGALVMESEDGDIITMNAIGGQIIYNENPLTAVHEHKYKADIKWPTCTEGGYTIYTCDCGESYRGDEVPATGHNWTPATCDAPETCTNCGLTQGEALGHIWVDATCDAPKTCTNCGATEGEALKHAWVDATCDAPKTCTNCGATEGEALGHAWADATCEEAKTCTICGATEGAALGHNWVDATCDAPKTCTTCGATEGAALDHNWVDATCDTPKTCTNCGETQGNALGHKWNAATCTEPRTCANCGMTEGSAMGHSWEEATCENAKYCTTCGTTEGEAMGHAWVDATCEEAKYCATCGEVEGTALGHAWEEATCETAKTCATCGKTEGEALGHDWNEGVVTVEPTEETEGEKIVTCCRCGLEEKRTVPALSHVHDYTSVETAPTCETAGYTTYTCKCGDSYVEAGAAALGHAYQSVVTEATCTTGGYTTHTCDRCGNTYTDGRVNALGHDYQSVVTAPTCTEDGYTTHTCRRCGEEKVDSRVGATGHSYTSVITKPTCTEGGYTTYTCAACGDSYVDNKTDAKGHSYSKKVTAPTCTEGGYTTYTCSGCGDSYVDNKTDAKGHSYSKKVTAPTCTEGGYTTYTCSACGHSYVDNKTAATGHDYDDGVVSGNKITYTCANCGHSYQETVEVSDNDVTVPGALTGLVDGTATYTWTAHADGYLTIDNASGLTGAYVSVTINGAAATSTNEGYLVAAGDKVVITVTTYSPVEINIPLGFNDGSKPPVLDESPMEFDVTWSAGSWDGYQGTWYAPNDGVYSFIITSSNIPASA